MELPTGTGDAILANDVVHRNTLTTRRRGHDAWTDAVDGDGEHEE
jgi:hypothetical protein